MADEWALGADVCGGIERLDHIAIQTKAEEVGARIRDIEIGNAD